MNRTDTGEAATPLAKLRERSEQALMQADNATLREALAISNDRCNSLIERQNTLIEDLTTKVKSLENTNDWNVNELKESVSSAVVAMKNLQDETRKLNSQIATETSQAIRRTTATLENELRQTIAVQSQEVFAEVKKELDENRKLSESTREELKQQGLVHKFLFWATPVLLLVQTVVLAFLLLK